MSTELARRPEDIRAEIATDPERRQELADATAELLRYVEGYITRYVILPDQAAATTCALFVLHTWAISAADATPYLIVVSSEPGSGKTRLLEVLGVLVCNPWQTSATTEVAMFRKIDKEHPTILLDELDTIFRGGSSHEALRAIINAGNRRGATVTRCDGKWDTREYETFGPKVMAGIDTGFIPATILDRSVVIRMHRRAGEQLERFRPLLARAEAAPALTTLAAWSGIVQDELAKITPVLPDTLSDRAADAWEPLLAIAAFAGQDWPEQALTAAQSLSGALLAGEEDEHLPVVLPAMEALLTGAPHKRPLGERIAEERKAEAVPA